MDERERHAELRQRYGDLFDQVSAVLFMADPIGINFESNTDEYDLEAGTVLPRLRDCRSSEDVQAVLHQEFGRWFGTGAVGPIEHYANPAAQIWQLWQQYLGPNCPA